MNFFGLFYQSAKQWLSCDMGHHAAAFSYYAPFALIPLLLISVGISGFFYGITFVKDIFLNWGTVFGTDLSALIDVAVQNLDIEIHTYQVPLIAIIFFCLLSIFAFNVLAVGFNKLWGSPQSGFRAWLRQSLRSALFILILQVYLISIIGFEGLWVKLGVRGITFLPELIWFLTISLVFVLFFKFLVEGSPSWRGCVMGGLTTGLLFILAKNLVAVYLAAKPVLTIFGAAGLILVLLVWVYVLSAIIYYGATVAYLYDREVIRFKKI